MAETMTYVLFIIGFIIGWKLASFKVYLWLVVCIGIILSLFVFGLLIFKRRKETESNLEGVL